MKKRMRFELKRKLFHLSAIILILIYFFAEQLFSRSIALQILGAILIIALAMEYFRLVKKVKFPLINILIRKKETNRIASHIYLLLGALIAFGLFDFRIALAVLLMTIFGDMAGALVGVRFGKHKITPDASWEGTIAEFVVDIIIGFMILGNTWMILAMALVATLVEAFFNKMDDNLSIPLCAGLTGYLISQFL